MKKKLKIDNHKHDWDWTKDSLAVAINTIIWQHWGKITPVKEAILAERERLREAMSHANGGGNWRRVLEQALGQENKKQ